MKILLVSESYWPNADGGALFERRLALGLIGRGNEVVVWAPATGFKGYLEQDGPYTIHRERAVTFFANTKYKVSFWPFWHARKLLLEVKPDVVHVHNMYLLGFATIFWAKRLGIPVVSTNHFMAENATMNLKWLNGGIGKPLFDFANKVAWKEIIWALNKADYVTTPTPTALDIIVSRGLKPPSEAISNGIDLGEFKPGLDTSELVKQYGVRVDVPVVLYVGRLDGEKRVDLIVRAFAEVLKKQPAQLVLAGYGKWMDSLKKLAVELGVEKDVVFTGYLDEALKPGLYNACSVFVIASPAELQSIVTLEAMATAKPVIAVDIAALSELCHDGENGFLFPADDFMALSSKVETIISDPALAKKFGDESLNIVRSKHSTEITFEKYEAAYGKARGIVAAKHKDKA
jgi:glycosyltransferase involved in cell wall biosynthesis